MEGAIKTDSMDTRRQQSLIKQKIILPTRRTGDQKIFVTGSSLLLVDINFVFSARPPLACLASHPHEILMEHLGTLFVACEDPIGAAT
ncbi:hypothetical protein PoB_003068300 [Plakobranchus ocellatus]|uniref:Uncharacterized protein n=1 Tax=Plakobranchus ocellatus TaxID=259542 RepID=A0AAV4AAC0_9GAST|nr:hypothetical protein PoB_003068300 [Plakobranchus ocellatus]